MNHIAVSSLVVWPQRPSCRIEDWRGGDRQRRIAVSSGFRLLLLPFQLFATDVSRAVGQQIAKHTVVVTPDGPKDFVSEVLGRADRKIS